jgi:hypothetical protein
MNFFEDTDFVFTRGPAGRIQSGGFTILNRLLNSKVHPMYTINQPFDSGTTNEMKKVSSMFEGFVVPIGLHLSQDEKEKRNADQPDENRDREEEEEEEESDDDVYETLLALKRDDEPNSIRSLKQKNSTTKRIHSTGNKQKTKRNTTNKNSTLF